jgi:UDP:flavonoid glycosyltransferase YjiC (YdhE family)
MPRCSLVIHHCETGIVFAVARAGVRLLIVSQMLDHFWAARVLELGLGHGPLSAADIAGPTIGQTIAQLLVDDTVRRRVREVRDALAGPARAAEVDAVLRDRFGVSVPQALCGSGLRPVGPVATATRQ